jgi:hypothetical protein
MDWVQSLTGDQKVKAGTVVAWQSVATTLNELVKHFNCITFGSEQQDLRGDREVQLKKVIIGMLYEMDSCLDYWAGILNGEGLLDQEVKDKKKEFKTACKKVGLDVLKSIRNGVAFHFTDYLSDPDAIVDTYTKIDQISLDSINEILRAANFCGLAMRQRVLETIK